MLILYIITEFAQLMMLDQETQVTQAHQLSVAHAMFHQRLIVPIFKISAFVLAIHSTLMLKLVASQLQPQNGSLTKVKFVQAVI